MRLGETQETPWFLCLKGKLPEGAGKFWVEEYLCECGVPKS